MCRCIITSIFVCTDGTHREREREREREIRLVFLFKGKSRTNVSLNKFDALVFKWSVAMENWKLGYEMWVNDRVAGHPVVLTSLKRERCHYILNSTSRCF